MRAVWYERPGPADEVLVVGEMSEPEPGAGEVLVRVAYSACHPSDVKLRAGGRPGVEGIGFERIIPHSDGSGTIEAVGEGVDPARIGEQVWLWNAQWQRPFGTCAELVALPAQQAVTLPEGVDLQQGACLGIPAVTAWACVLGDGPVEGETILVTGGAGAVSAYAIQIAKREGARVIATASTPEKQAFAADRGADTVIDYREGRVARRVMELTKGEGVHRIVDLEFGANLDATAEIVRENGLIVTYGSAATREPVLPFYPLMFKRVTLRLELVYLLPAPLRRRAEAWLDSNAAILRHDVHSVTPLPGSATAHRIVEAGDKRGVVLMKV